MDSGGFPTCDLAVFAGGVVTETSITVAVEGQMKIGHFTLAFSDLAVPLAGLDIEVLRNYDIRTRRLGPQTEAPA